jgi:hypothetical protein
LADPGKNDSCSTEIEAQSKYTELRRSAKIYWEKDQVQEMPDLPKGA